jgi:LysM repeat protein
MDSKMFNRTGKVMVSLLLAIVLVVPLLLTVFSLPAQAATDPYCSEYYKVKSGDKLREIAEKFGVTLNRLARANDVQKTYRPTAGEELCIPSLVAFASSTSWFATYDGTKITLDGSGFKKNYPMVLRARVNDTQRLVTIARGISSNKNGELERSFKVPKDLVDKVSLIVCLKDGVTDGLACKLVWRR